jgi:outer membrane protein assembly factor BamB
MRHILLTLLTLILTTVGLSAHDWPSARGPENTGVSREKNLPDTFDPQSGKNILWQQPYGGISTPIVMKGRVYVINRTGTSLEKGGQGIDQQERVMCFDAKTGDKVWERRFNVWLTDIVASRLGWGEVCGDPETGNVYAHGTQGLLVCLDGKSGKTIWQRSLTEQFGRVTGYGGRVTSPVVWEDLVILSMANGSWGEQAIGQTRFVAFDKRTGKVVWWGSGGYRVRNTFSSTPVVAVIGGEALVVGGGGDGCVHAFKARTGEKVWSYKFGDGAINCSPVVQGDRVFIGHGGSNPNGTQGLIICVDGAKVKNGKPELVWQKDGIRVWYSSLLLHDGRLYVHNDRGRVFCLDTKDGEDVWVATAGRNTKGSPVWADGKLFQTEVDGGFYIYKLMGERRPGRTRPIRFRPKGGARVVDVDGSVAVANGRIYFMTTEELFCVGYKDHNAKADPIPAGPKEKPAIKDAKPAHLQVIPADVTLAPGESVEFKVRAFDASGLLICETKAEWSLAGMLPPVFPIGLPHPPAGGAPPAPPPAIKGELSAASGTGTKFTASKSVPGQFGRVIAKMGKLTAHARVRVAPHAPYETDFARVPNGKIPAGWVNCQGKFSVATVGGHKVLKKRNNNPNALLSQSYTFIGPPQARDYTIEADVFSSKKDENLSDVGILNCRYSLVLQGNQQRLGLLSWEVDPPRGRINKTIDWEWKPDTWYTMKLRVSVAGGKATVQGKVWPKGQSEPEKWSVEVEDPNPNTEGAPGLYGYSKGINAIGELGTEIYYGRVKVTPNK